MKPLAGIRVLDLTRLLPGGFCTMLLSDLGADVLKIEEPGRGDYVRWNPPFHGDTSAGHLALNRGKRSMTLNLKHGRGREILTRLAASADVLIESYRPGVLDRLGAGYEAISPVNPAIVWCAITGYGQDGPYRDLAGHDVNYLGYAGVSDITGTAGGAPAMSGAQIADIGGGALMAAVGILAALHEARSSGRGRFVDISMTDGSLAWLSFHAQSLLFTGFAPQRGLMPLNGGMACYRIYPCGDGKFLAVGALEPQFWERLCTALEVTEFIPKHVAPWEEQQPMIARLTEIFSTSTRDEWVKRLRPIDACIGPINSVEEALRDPQLLSRGMVTESKTADGVVPVLGTPIRERGEAQEPLPPAPGFGEHTEAVLQEAGYSDEEIAALRNAGAV